ncbi:glycolate oxidase subunit GlcF [Sphingomonas quercus]|uniref:Glycolate oxidase iron-sulfur subunit n=1 Tax=Sphingomonas quercus TaxID=2842451 RepID=A0ABS6BIR6_9SPHN|nr:glycolate oxidase subunit GlcF [Sphingomonas quercus]MBU3078210.1 glycolate oxidase subunit GlcF [Sphingomonas quercus]
MQTSFTDAQLKDADTASSNAVLRKCVHCGFCTATCPTYLLLGDELDSPRGRIYLMKDMLEQGGAPAPSTVKHIDRCLSCLSCMTTCPSGVNYMHLVDHARAHIEDHYTRPLPERMLRSLLATVLPNRALFRVAAALGRLARPLAPLMPGRLKGMLTMAPARLPARGRVSGPGTYAAEGARTARMALLYGCVQPVLRPSIDDAAVRLLNRHGVEVVVASGGGCCGALPHHMGKSADAHALAKVNIAAWEAEMARGLDAIIITASGCGTTVKDYGFMFRDDPEWAERAARVSALARDISEVLADLDLLPPVIEPGMPVAYHSACSMQHGQQIRTQPRALLARAGFAVREVGEGHICCGSAGTYSILQPELSQQLRARKLGNIAATGAEIVATGNIGCITHLEGGGARMIHTVELLDWATGGPRPAGV